MNIEDVTLDQVYEFMERGNINNAPEHIVKYLELIEKVRGLIFRTDIYGNSQSVVNHMKLLYGFSDYKAKKVYNETIQFFYVDNEVSKSAWRNLYADKMERVINFAMGTMKDVSDASKVIKMYVDLANLRQVNEPDKEELPDNFFDKPINLLTMDANVFEFGTANRKNLEKFIDAFPDLTEKEKNRIKQEALALPIKLFPDESENPRK